MELEVLKREVIQHQQGKEDKDLINKKINKWIIMKTINNKKKNLVKWKLKMDRMVKKVANMNNKTILRKMMDKQMKINDPILLT